jgi:predicted O-methyltransferase YrrM
MFDFGRHFICQLIEKQCGLNSLSVIRYFSAWKQSQQEGRSPLTDRRPWMTFQSVSLLDRNVMAGSRVFEYGGGGSTLYFLDKGADVVTVEHDCEWFERLSRVIRQDGFDAQWQGFYQPPEDNVPQDGVSQAGPDSYRSCSQAMIGKTFMKYVDTIHRFPDGHFNFVIVDGRARPSCVKQSAPKVQTGGFLVLDNTERSYYMSRETLGCLTDFDLVLDKFGPSPYEISFTKTTVWQRRSGSR